MAYERQNFTDGKTLTAEQLNHIEDGIVNMTPVRGEDYWTEEDIAEIKDAVPSVAVALATGTAIAQNTDLNIVTEFGNYKCTNSANVKTLLNCPVDTAFIMRVGSPAPGVANYFYQEIITLTGVRFYRYGYPSSGVLKWKNWQKTFDTNSIIPARYGGMGANISSDLGEAAHLDACQKFIDKMNEMAVSIGMKNTTFKTPSGLNRKPVNANKVAVSNEYNSHTTAYDLLRLMVAVKHTPTVLTAMGSARCDYFKNGGGYYALHSCLGNSTWTAWAEENGYTILAAKGGSLSGEYGEIGSDGIMNFAFLIQSGGDVYAVSVVGLNNDEFDALRTIVRDLISGATNSTAISEANNREYPVGMAVAKLTNGCFDDDITALESGTFYNENEVRVTASIAKIMTALVATHYMGNYECSINYDDLVGGAAAVTFAVGDIISTTDALSLMLAVSDNTMATMLARVCGNGDTPKKGVDYWTEEDKAEIKSYVDEAILGGEW